VARADRETGFVRLRPGRRSGWPGHSDPFDRLLIAQVVMNGLAIVTSDSAFDPYPVRVIW
jgi:PIN domain nuclease of toxin-antitoxin system